MSEMIIRSIALHFVGNRTNDEPFLLSKKPYAMTGDMNTLLTEYFVSSFKSEERFNFHDDMGLENNRVFRLVSDIFDNPHMLYDFSVDLATHLYDNCDHPKIKGGYFIVAHITGLGLGSEIDEAVGLFKIENKETFITVEYDDEEFDITPIDGINLKRLDKGCLIMNYEREKGYMVAVVDKTNAQSASYWVDDFLHLKRRQDSYFQTENVMDMARNFVAEELPKQFDLNRADQADLLNRTMYYFKNTPQFDMTGFGEQVMAQPEVVDMFSDYRRRYEEERQMELENRFEVNPAAVKKQNRYYKSVIKLDKNFHIYVHGNRNLIEQSEDERGKYYKLYFREES